jgi:hypothetical protein
MGSFAKITDIQTTRQFSAFSAVEPFRKMDHKSRRGILVDNSISLSFALFASFAVNRPWLNADC